MRLVRSISRGSVLECDLPELLFAAYIAVKTEQREMLARDYAKPEVTCFSNTRPGNADKQQSQFAYLRSLPTLLVRYFLRGYFFAKALTC